MNKEQLDRALVSGPRQFSHGFTSIVNPEKDEFSMEMDFGIHCLQEGEVIDECHPQESTWVLLQGKARLEFVGRCEEVERGSIFDEAPTCLNLGADTQLTLTALSNCEWAVVRWTMTKNCQRDCSLRLIWLLNIGGRGWCKMPACEM